MINQNALTSLQKELADRLIAGDFTPLKKDITLVVRTVKIEAVSSDMQQVFVRYDDNTAEMLQASEIASIADLEEVQPAVSED